MLYYVYITKYRKIICDRDFFQDSKAGSNIINSQKSLEISWAATHVLWSMHSKNTINETKHKKTKKIKLRLKMVAGLQRI